MRNSYRSMDAIGYENPNVPRRYYARVYFSDGSELVRGFWTVQAAKEWVDGTVRRMGEPLSWAVIRKTRNDEMIWNRLRDSEKWTRPRK